MVFSLSTVLAVAKKHCFYDETVTYPPASDIVDEIVKQTAGNENAEQLATWPLLRKKTLYTTIERLVNDESPDNTYRQSSYISITGGGRGSLPLFFATDVRENRRQRAEFGKLIASTGMLGGRDWVLSMHSAGGLYRALDLTLEYVEEAGACTLAAGHVMPVPAVLQLLVKYKVNVLAGDSSQVIDVVNHLSALPREEQDKIRLDKILYTSEVLTGSQRAHIRATLGQKIKICSALASAETGPWAFSNPDLTGDRTTTSSDFVYDTRTMAVEIFPHSAAEEDASGMAVTAPQPLADGETGLIVLTSLCRLRNPLVRYISGDVGSLHDLPEAVRHLVKEADRPHIRVLRLEGRDRRFSFDWEGEYIEFANLAGIVEDPRYGILQWQAIIENRPHEQEGLRPCLEVRMLPSTTTRSDDELLGEMVGRIKTLIAATSANADRFTPVFLENADGFEKSKTGGKVIKFIDRVS
ncbi:hypothetical protein LMH87_002133 [Akanthomyces muscarius]|uniref:Uncharacterized protein n=1 Tax=Akanthomyces muscarius TaxID=2231603 RepID=A0A9W8UGT4_AKAMU|nr:hypothetical protein LMH87_002133 [Akanthomyces muscarius]KAJ4147621.1 hypothetical protein LMH87_002133 [Akanthomyces muscarius]